MSTFATLDSKIYILCLMFVIKKKKKVISWHPSITSQINVLSSSKCSVEALHQPMAREIAEASKAVLRRSKRI